MPKANMIKKTCPARIGFLGNPSDGFGGKTISLPLRNFQAEVIVWPSPTLKFILNTEDQDEYAELPEMISYLQTNGYYGGIRLIKAAIVSFCRYCNQHNIKLPSDNFTISYRSNIPRQSGLAGSSAIITATIKALIEFYAVDEKAIPPAILANIALAAETEELGIAAGLQDRVVQAFNQPVFMDFSSQAFAGNNNLYGDYKVIDKKLFPSLLIAWNNRPSESGKVHSNIKARFAAGDRQVIEAMKQFASFAADGMTALKKNDYNVLFSLINANFDLRRSLYGDQVVGAENIKMVELARRLGAAAKFPGSGGAIIIFPHKPSQAENIINNFVREGYLIEKVTI